MFSLIYPVFSSRLTRIFFKEIHLVNNQEAQWYSDLLRNHSLEEVIKTEAQNAVFRKYWIIKHRGEAELRTTDWSVEITDPKNISNNDRKFDLD